MVAGNIRALITGGSRLADLLANRRLRPSSCRSVPTAAGQRPDSADLVPAEVVAQLKGRDMMVQRFAELLRASTAGS